MSFSDQLQAQLRRSYANPEYTGSGCFWDLTSFWNLCWSNNMHYQLCLDLYRDQDYDWAILCLIPMRRTKPLPYPIIPGPWHRTWAIDVSGPPLAFVEGTLAEAKHKIDSLLASPSPPIPPFPSEEDWRRILTNL